MGVNCGASCVKIVLFVFNIVFFLGGAAVLGLGIWLRADSGSFTYFLDKVDPSGQATQVTDNIIGKNVAYINTVAYILIGVGSFVFLVGFMGCCGAIKEWRPLLVGYAICLIIIMCAEIGVGIAVGVYKDEVVGALEKEIKQEVLKDYSYMAWTTETNKPYIVKPVPNDNDFPSNKSRLATNVMNTLHVALGCCGLRNYTDLLGDTTTPSPYKNRGHSDAPVFCCRFVKPELLEVNNTDTSCLTDRNTRNSYSMTGCINKVEDFVTQYAPAVIGVAVGIGLIELVGIFFAFCLCCAISDVEKGYRYH